MSVQPISSELAWGTLVAAVVANFAFRGVGTVLSGRVRADGEFFKWVTAVTYALMAGLTARLLVLPSGLLAEVPMAVRLLVMAATMGVMLTNPARRMVPALTTGCLITLIYGFWRSGLA